MILLLLIPFIITQAMAAATNICDLIDLKGCSGVSKQSRRSTMVSTPSPATAASINPASVSLDRGFGMEVVHQAGNPLVFSLASGTGKMGGALIGQNLENSFFGNRVPEIEDVYFTRRDDQKQYKSKKLNLAVGGRIIHQRHVAMDVGMLLKRHSEIKRINPGAGIAGRIGPITFGASYYQDDVHLELKDYVMPYTGIHYSTFYGNDVYTERFNVETYSLGTRIKNLALDAGIIKTRYKFYGDDSRIHLYSASYQYKHFLFNLGLRHELTPAWKYVDGRLVDERKKNETYLGTQASIGRHLILGVNYNYFLLRELSFSATVFF